MRIPRVPKLIVLLAAPVLVFAVGRALLHWCDSVFEGSSYERMHIAHAVPDSTDAVAVYTNWRDSVRVVRTDSSVFLRFFTSFACAPNRWESFVRSWTTCGMEPFTYSNGMEFGYPLQVVRIAQKSIYPCALAMDGKDCGSILATDGTFTDDHCLRIDMLSSEGDRVIGLTFYKPHLVSATIATVGGRRCVMIQATRE